MVPAAAAAFPRPSVVGGVDVGSFQPLLIATLLLVNVPLDSIDSLMMARKLTAAANIHAIDTCFDFDRSNTAEVVTDGDTPGSSDEAAGDTALQEILLQYEERCVLRVTSSLAAARGYRLRIAGAGIDAVSIAATLNEAGKEGLLTTAQLSQLRRDAQAQLRQVDSDDAALSRSQRLTHFKAQLRHYSQSVNPSIKLEGHARLIRALAQLARGDRGDLEVDGEGHVFTVFRHHLTALSRAEMHDAVTLLGSMYDARPLLERPNGSGVFVRYGTICHHDRRCSVSIVVMVR
jgi:hypothetical protein